MSFKKVVLIFILIGFFSLGVFFVLQKNGEVAVQQTEVSAPGSQSGIVEEGEDKYPPSMRIEIDRIKLIVDVAETEEEKAKGLSGRAGLGEEEGMLFVYDKPDKYSFWMKDMRFPIDIIWIGEDLKVVDITENLQPESFPERFTPKEKVKYVAEVNAGWVKDDRVHIGSPVLLEDTGGNEPEAEESEELPSPSPNTPAQPISSSKVLFDVLFTPQAVFGNWDDIRQSNACEEASALMAMRWVEGKDLPLAEAEREIIAISDFELEKYGHFHDTSAEDTAARIFGDYFHYDGVSVRYGVDADDIKNELDSGNLVVAPFDGRKLANPYYTPPGPPLHMLVVRGYDDATREFITNDPGTKRGEAYRYKYNVLENAMADYSSGYNEPGARSQSAMIVVGPR